MQASNSGFTNASTLKELASEKGLYYGSAIGIDPEQDKFLGSAIVSDCSIVVPEWQMKWAALRPTPQTFDFGAADTLVDFARDNGIAVRGHNLVWHDALPNWFSGYVTSQNARVVLTDHIQTVVGRYAEKIHSWDVVNEVINISDGNPNGLRNSPWLELLGSDYIKIAFDAAHAADPSVVLTYNEYGLDYSFDEDKRACVLNLIESELNKNTRIEALGIQAHLNIDAVNEFDGGLMQTFLGNVAALGLQIVITELDIIDKSLPQEVEVRDRSIADFYKKYLDCVLSEPAVSGVLTWGMSDRYTWIKDYAPRVDGCAVRPLPLDKYMVKKPVWYAIAESLAGAESR